MKIFFIRKRSLIKCALAVALLVGILAATSLISHTNTASVFAVSKELPIYYVDMKEKAAAITFDCAWGSSDIPEILQTLKKENIKATFFMVGLWAEKYPEIARMIAAEGHDIANHGYSHLRMDTLDSDKISNEISKCSNKLSEITGTKVDLFRPPYGAYNNNVIKITNNLKHYPIQWNVDSLDWKPGISQQEILGRIMNKIKPGSILLFHNDTPHTAKLLPTIITNLKNEGYSLIPVSKMIIKENYRIDSDGKQTAKE